MPGSSWWETNRLHERASENKDLPWHFPTFWAAKAVRGSYLAHSPPSLVTPFPMAAENCKNCLWWQNTCNLVMQFVVTKRKSHDNNDFREQVMAQRDERKEWKTQVLRFPQERKHSPKAYCDQQPTGAEIPSALGPERCWQHLPRMWSEGEYSHNILLSFTRKHGDSRQCSPTSPLLSLTDTSFVYTSWVINRILFFIPLLLPLGFPYFWSQRRR